MAALFPTNRTFMVSTWEEEVLKPYFHLIYKGVYMWQTAIKEKSRLVEEMRDTDAPIKTRTPFTVFLRWLEFNEEKPNEEIS